MSFLKSINPFYKQSVEEISNNLLYEYQRKVVEFSESAAYSKKMAEFYQEGVERLSPNNPDMKINLE